MKDELKKLVGENEKIMYEGKPDFKCFLFESIFNPLLPIAIIWGIFDFGILGFSIFTSEEKGFLFFIIPFMLLHLMPVWLYLGGVIFSIRKHKNTEYIVTDKAIYVSGGIFTRNFNTKPFAEMSHIDLHRGIFDQWFGVGDIICTSNQRAGEVTSSIMITSISNYIETYNLIKKLQTDIYSDIMYPNDMRPAENHGYNTEYKGIDK